MRAQQVLAKLVITDLKRGLKKYNFKIEKFKRMYSYAQRSPYSIIIACHPPMPRPMVKGHYMAVEITPSCKCKTIRIYQDARTFNNISGGMVCASTLCEHNIADPNLTNNILPVIIKHTDHRSILRRPKHKRGCQHYVKGSEYRIGPQCKKCKNLPS